MLKFTILNNTYEANDCYKTIAVVKDLVTQSPKVNDFAVINLSKQEGNNQTNLDILKGLVGQSNAVDIKNDSGIVIASLDSAYMLTSVNEQISLDGTKIVNLSFNKN